ncbi:hypothetical protein ACHAXS_012139 [Conticribra weissflogii]
MTSEESFLVTVCRGQKTSKSHHKSNMSYTIHSSCTLPTCQRLPPPTPSKPIATLPLSTFLNDSRNRIFFYGQDYVRKEWHHLFSDV